MKSFEFHAELFELRSAVLDALSDKGFMWLSDFGSVDLQHDVFGLEVTGILEETDAEAIEDLLQEMLFDWDYHRHYYEDKNQGEIGWKVIISREPEDYDDTWDEGDGQED